MKKNTVKSPGAVIEEELEKRFLNQADVSKAIGVSQTTVYYAIKKNKVSLNIALRLEKYLRLEKDYFVKIIHDYELYQLENDEAFKTAYEAVVPYAVKKEAKNPKAGKAGSGGPAGGKRPGKRAARP
jgi:plasmid maintenance system antidote protein VapI